MHRKSHIIRDERGSVLVIALLTLSFLTIIGILATRTSTTDIQIANNERINCQFYQFRTGQPPKIVAGQYPAIRGAERLKQPSQTPVYS